MELSAHEGHLGDWMSDPAAAQRDIESAGLRAWSVHSPGTSFDLAASAEAARAAAVASAASCFAPAAGVADVVVVHCNAPGKPFDPADYDESLMRTRGSELEDGHAFGRGVVWSTARVDLGEANILDAELLTEQLDLLVESVVLGRKAYSGVDAVGSPAASGYDGVVGQGDDVDDGGPDAGGPF